MNLVSFEDAAKADLNYAWASGVLEGEGCISIFSPANKTYKTVAIHCEMTDEDVIKRLQAVFKCGNINHRQSKHRRVDGKTRQDTFIWSVYKKIDVFNVLLRIYPNMCFRRSMKCGEALGILECQLVK